MAAHGRPIMSPTLLAALQGAERCMRRDVAHCRRWYRRTGMTTAQVRYYGDRRNWPDACQLVRLDGAGPY
jgi:hypothetical protein